MPLPFIYQLAAKDSADVLDYTFDFTNWLEAGDTITSGSFACVPSNMTASTASVNGNMVTSLLSGGSPDTSYTISCTAQTANGLTVKRYASIQTLGTLNTNTSTTAATFTTGNTQISGLSVNGVTGSGGMTIDTWSAGLYRSATYVVQASATDGSGYQTTNLIVMQVGGNAYLTSYGALIAGPSTSPNVAIINFSVAMVAGNVVLTATGVNAAKTYNLDATRQLVSL